MEGQFKESKHILQGGGWGEGSWVFETWFPFYLIYHQGQWICGNGLLAVNKYVYEIINTFTQILVIHLNRNQRTAWRIDVILMNCIWSENKGIVNSSHQVFPSYDSYLKLILIFNRIVALYSTTEKKKVSYGQLLTYSGISLILRLCGKIYIARYWIKIFEKNLMH